MSYLSWDLFGLFLVVFHKSLCISFIKKRRRKILLANLYMEANILHWPSTACAITTVHKLHCLPTLTKKHHPHKAEHQIKLTGIRNPDRKAFVSAMQKSCWYFLVTLSYSKGSYLIAYFWKTVHLTAKQWILHTYSFIGLFLGELEKNSIWKLQGILNIPFPNYACISWIQ